MYAKLRILTAQALLNEPSALTKYFVAKVPPPHLEYCVKLLKSMVGCEDCEVSVMFAWQCVA